MRVVKRRMVVLVMVRMGRWILIVRGAGTGVWVMDALVVGCLVVLMEMTGAGFQRRQR
jgi:hypothetical protein